MHSHLLFNAMRTLPAARSALYFIYARGMINEGVSGRPRSFSHCHLRGPGSVCNIAAVMSLDQKFRLVFITDVSLI